MILCIILWALWFYLNKKVKDYKENEEQTNFVEMWEDTNKIFLVVISIITVIIIFNSLKKPPHFEEFKASVEQVMELNKPIVKDCKVDKKSVKIYLNKSEWSQMGLTDHVNTKQRIKSTINTIGKNTGYIPNNKEVYVVFYGDD